MKKLQHFTKKLFSILCATALMLPSSMAVMAAEPAVAVPSQTYETPTKNTLVDVVYFTVDADGELKTSDTPVSTRAWLDDRITGSFSFYDQGSKNGRHYYEVQMKAVAIDNVTFSYAKLSVKPKNNTKFIDSETHPKNTAFANDAIQYYYEGDGPSSPTVSVKASFTTSGGNYNIKAHTLKNPIS